MKETLSDGTKVESFGSKFAGTMDHVVGTIVLGGLGHVGFHLGKVPGVGTAGEYVRENVSEGFQAASKADQIRKTANDIARLMNDGKTVSSETIASMCRDAKIPAESIEAVRNLAESKASSARKGGPIPAPQAG